MRILIQRVRKAKVKVEGDLIDFIGQGLLVFLGIENEDDTNDLKWLVNKLLHLRIFNDEKQVMNRSLLDVKGELMVISQFTLMAATKKVIDQVTFVQLATKLQSLYMKNFCYWQRKVWVIEWPEGSSVLI